MATKPLPRGIRLSCRSCGRRCRTGVVRWGHPGVGRQSAGRGRTRRLGLKSGRSAVRPRSCPSTTLRMVGHKPGASAGRQRHDYLGLATSSTTHMPAGILPPVVDDSCPRTCPPSHWSPMTGQLLPEACSSEMSKTLTRLCDSSCTNRMSATRQAGPGWLRLRLREPRHRYVAAPRRRRRAGRRG